VFKVHYERACPEHCHQKIQNDCQLNNVCRRDEHQLMFQVFQPNGEDKDEKKTIKGTWWGTSNIFISKYETYMCFSMVVL
jgi:hypothetical protein